MRHALQYAFSPGREGLPDAASTQPSVLWAAVHLPFLALEALPPVAADEYAVVTEPSGRGEVVYGASGNARSAGIEPGMTVSAALAVCAGLRVYTRDPAAERAHLDVLHRWASRFTPTVSTEPPATLLFELSASLRLFGGVEALYARLCRELARTGLRGCLAATPTPGASSMLASAGRGALIVDAADLRRALHALPIDHLDLTGEALRRLRAAGISSLEELWRLPRHGLARRFGPAVLRSLDRVLGMHPDPRPIDAVPARFEGCRTLEAETIETGPILKAARLLMVQFSEFLTARNALAGGIRVALEHAGQPATRIDVKTRLPMRDATQWEKLLGERIERRELPAPVGGLRLSGWASPGATPTGGDLFRTSDAARDWAHTLDELEARLGSKCLWIPGVTADHRPECAWQKSPPSPTPSPVLHQPRRPLWLLPTPRLLRGRERLVPTLESLDLVDGPERIESGWWDDNECCRDYYTAVCPLGRRLWVFRDLKQDSGWYLHGLFG